MRGLALAFAGACFAMTTQSSVRADDPVWNSPDEAEAFLSDALPRITRENPKYLTKADGSVSEWFTDKLSFSRNANNSAQVAMVERFTQTRGGAATAGRHEASFSLSDVAISEFVGSGDVTPSGAPSRGVLFTCTIPGCIAARWNDDASRADKTDISIQADDARARILSAFQYLKAHGK